MADTDETTPEQSQAMAEIGQKVVDIITDEVHAKGIADLQYVMHILASVSAFYLSGVGDEQIREEVYNQFGDLVREGVAAHLEAGKTARVDVFDATKPN